MRRELEQASKWAQVVGSWIGDSPKKAVTFGLACAFVGYLIRWYFGG